MLLFGPSTSGEITPALSNDSLLDKRWAYMLFDSQEHPLVSILLLVVAVLSCSITAMITTKYLGSPWDLLISPLATGVDPGP
jgi:hypothetical protein